MDIYAIRERLNALLQEVDTAIKKQEARKPTVVGVRVYAASKEQTLFAWEAYGDYGFWHDSIMGEEYFATKRDAISHALHVLVPQMAVDKILFGDITGCEETGYFYIDDEGVSRPLILWRDGR